MEVSVNIEEKQWLEDLKLGDQKALRQIFNQYYKYLLVTAFNIVGEEEKAKDFVQDVFFELWKKRENIHIHSSIKPYLRKAVVNKALNFLKSQKRMQWGDEALDYHRPSQDIDAQQQLETKDLQAVITDAIESLPAKCRIVFSLSRFEDLSHKEIAEKLNISTKTIENHMTKALRIIRIAIREYGMLDFWIIGVLVNWLIS